MFNDQVKIDFNLAFYLFTAGVSYAYNIDRIVS